MTNREASEWFKKRAQETPMPGAREAFKLAAEALANADVPDNNVGDLISKQAAIDAIGEKADEIYKTKQKGATYPHNDFFQGMAYAEYVVKQLPSAQLKIIRCKDCKHWIPYDWMFSEVWQSKNIADYPEDEIGCDCCDMAMKANDFCSRVERRET